MSYPSMQMQSPDYAQREFREGLQKLKTASILYIISALLTGLVPTLMLLGGFSFGKVGIMAGGIGMLVAAIVGAILGLVALFAFLVPAFTHLRNSDPSMFGTAATLVKIGYAVGFILFIIGLALVISAIFTLNPGMVFGGLGLFVIGAIFLLIGLVGLIIGMFRLKDKTGETLFLVAGILFIIGIFLGILQFVAWILVFVAANSTLNKLSSIPSAQQGYVAPPPPSR